MFSLILIAASCFLVGLMLAHTRAIPTAREGSLTLATVVWRAADDLRKVVSLQTFLTTAFVSAALAGMVVVWYHVTTLVFNDLFAEMARIKLGSLTLPQVLALGIVIAELGVGFAIDWAASMRKSGGEQRWTSAVIAGSLVLLAALLTAELLIGARRIHIVANMIEAMTQLPEAVRTRYADGIRESLMIFLILSAVFPIVIAGLGFLVHNLLPSGVRAVVAAPVYMVSIFLKAVAGLLLPLIGFVFVMIPVGLLGIFSPKMRELAKTGAFLIPLTFFLACSGGENGVGSVKAPATTASASLEKASGEQIPRQCPFVCFVDLSDFDSVRKDAVSECVQIAKSTIGPAFILGIGERSDSSNAPQLVIEGAQIKECDPPEASNDPTSTLEVLGQEAAQAAYQTCLDFRNREIEEYRKVRGTRLDKFVARMKDERGEPRTDLVGAFRRVADWIRDADIRGADLHVYSDMEDTVTPSVALKKIPEAQCSNLPPLDLSHILSTQVFETVTAHRSWKTTELLRREWKRILGGCWKVHSLDFTTFTPENANFRTQPQATGSCDDFHRSHTRSETVNSPSPPSPQGQGEQASCQTDACRPTEDAIGQIVSELPAEKSVGLVIDDTKSMDDPGDREAVAGIYQQALRKYGHMLSGYWLFGEHQVRSFSRNPVFQRLGGYENTFQALQEAGKRADLLILITDEPGDDLEDAGNAILKPIVVHCLGNCLNLRSLAERSHGCYIEGGEKTCWK